CSRLSSAAFSPTSGLDPAPRPLVSFSPSWTRRGALEMLRAWASVFMLMNSTPWSPASIMRLMALPPPPPTPTTLIVAYCPFPRFGSYALASPVRAPVAHRQPISLGLIPQPPGTVPQPGPAAPGVNPAATSSEPRVQLAPPGEASGIG